MWYKKCHYLKEAFSWSSKIHSHHILKYRFKMGQSLQIKSQKVPHPLYTSPKKKDSMQVKPKGTAQPPCTVSGSEVKL